MNNFLSRYDVEEVYSCLNILMEFEDETDEFDFYKLLYLLQANLIDRSQECIDEGVFFYNGRYDEDED